METGKLRRQTVEGRGVSSERKKGKKNPVQTCFIISYGTKVIILFSMSWEGRQWWKTSCGGSRLHWTWDEEDKQVNKPPADLNDWHTPLPHTPAMRKGGHADNVGSSSSVCKAEKRLSRQNTRTHAGLQQQHKPTQSWRQKKKQFRVMMKSHVYLIIRIRLHILWCSMMHCGQRRDDTMDKARKLSWAGEQVGKPKFRAWKWSSEKQEKAS